MAEIDKPYRMRYIEQERGMTFEAIVTKAIEAGRGREEIAQYLDISLPTLRSWIEICGGREKKTMVWGTR